jgi:hypothetical protein
MKISGDDCIFAMFCGDETAEKPHLSKVIIQVGMTKKHFSTFA